MFSTTNPEDLLVCSLYDQNSIELQSFGVLWAAPMESGNQCHAHRMMPDKHLQEALFMGHTQESCIQESRSIADRQNTCYI